MPTKILIYGHDQMLLSTRRLILEQAGHTVDAVDEPDLVQKALIETTIRLLILCQTLSDTECKIAVEMAFILRPEVKIMLMVASRPRVFTADHQNLFHISAGPHALIQTVHQIISPARTVSAPN